MPGWTFHRPNDHIPPMDVLAAPGPPRRGAAGPVVGGPAQSAGGAVAGQGPGDDGEGLRGTGRLVSQVVLIGSHRWPCDRP